MGKSITERSSGLRIVVIGSGDVGIRFALALERAGADVAMVPGRSAQHTRRKTERFGLTLREDFAAAVGGADIVLSVVTGDGSLAVARRVLESIGSDAIFADLTAAAPDAIYEAAAAFTARGRLYVDAAIMGAVSLLDIRTPIFASGPDAPRFADIMNGFGFEISSRPGSKAGDASMLKLLRSIFAKGLDALSVEVMLAARAFGLQEELLEQMGDFDRLPIRQTIEMYIRTHPASAARRHKEMLETAKQLAVAGLRSFSTDAALARYSHTMALLARFPPHETDDANAAANLEWLLDAERRMSEKKF